MQKDSQGAIIAKGDLTPCSTWSVAARTTELMLQWLRIRYNRVGGALSAAKSHAGRMLKAARVARTLPVGNTGFDLEGVNVGMSPLSHRLLGRFDYDKILRTRQRNFQFLEERLAGRARLLPVTLSGEVCPLFFPLLVRDKKYASQALARHGIDTVEFWNQGDPEAERDGYPAQYFRRHVLEIPIHQDVTLDHLDHTARCILRLKLHL